MTEPPRRPKVGAQSRVIYLNQSMCDKPFTIDQNDVTVKLVSDIVFDFGKDHPDVSPHHRGFFGGILIGASRVVLDLNGYTMKMSKQYQDTQRFFSLITLDVTPFPVGKGGGFTTIPLKPSDITIRNGTLGLTSHFAIHTSNGNERVLIEDLNIDDFEISAISLSGCSDVWIRRCKIGGPIAPTTTSSAVMLRSLLLSLERKNADDNIKHNIRKRLRTEESIKLQSLDCIVRNYCDSTEI